MNELPFRRQVPFKPFVSAPVDPAIVSGGNPATPVADPDRIIDENQNGMENTARALSGSTSKIPDGWISRTVAQERLSLASIEIDSRRIRHLCARNELVSVKVKNEKNQPQYFINPVSLDEFIAKNRPANVSGGNPDQPTASPASPPDQTQESAAKHDPAPSGQTEVQPDQPTGQIGAAELVPKAQLDQALETIEFLKDEVRHSRSYKNDTAQIANRMLETLETIAVGGKLLPPQEPPRQRHPMHVDVPESGAGDSSYQRTDSV